MKTTLLSPARGLFPILTLTGFIVAVGGDPAKNQAVKFKITTAKMDDSIVIQGDESKTLLAVKSPVGIGQAVIEPALTKNGRKQLCCGFT